MRTVTGKDDYDPSWTENPLVVRLLCEYDGVSFSSKYPHWNLYIDEAMKNTICKKTIIWSWSARYMKFTYVKFTTTCEHHFFGELLTLTRCPEIVQDMTNLKRVSHTSKEGTLSTMFHILW